MKVAAILLLVVGLTVFAVGLLTATGRSASNAGGDDAAAACGVFAVSMDDVKAGASESRLKFQINLMQDYAAKAASVNDRYEPLRLAMTRLYDGASAVDVASVTRACAELA